MPSFIDQVLSLNPLPFRRVYVDWWVAVLFERSHQQSICKTRNDMPQPEVVNNTLNSTSWYILYTHNFTWSLFALESSLECSIAANENWFDWFSHRGLPRVNSRLRLKYGATIQRGGDRRFIGNEPHNKLKGEDWYKRSRKKAYLSQLSL